MQYINIVLYYSSKFDRISKKESYTHIQFSNFGKI